MQRQLTFKIMAIVALMILLLIPITMIKILVYERTSLRDGVVNDIANSYARNQKLKGPLLVIPYNKTVYDSNDKKYYQDKGQIYFLPDELNMTSELTVNKLNRSIYEACIYNTTNKINGFFDIPADFGIKTDLEDYQFEQPFLVMGITDTRGIGNQSTITFDNKTLTIQPGTNNSKMSSGIHANVHLDDSKKSGKYSFTIQFELKGTSKFSFTPVGKETTVKINSNWPHPSFIGNFLPSSRDITSQGFTATWQTNAFASDIESKFQACLTDNCFNFDDTAFTVSLVDPVDQYTKTNRAIKYGILFIGLTFFGFFLFEMIRKLAIHPIQYSFVGMSLAIFFLLLLSLSEYIGFALAYLSSAIACIGIISFYITGVLENKKQALIFTCLLTLVYIMLYVLLNAEEYSLIMGSLLVFIILSIAMIATRQLNWYKITTQNPLNKDTKQPEESHHE